MIVEFAGRNIAGMGRIAVDFHKQSYAAFDVNKVDKALTSLEVF